MKNKLLAVIALCSVTSPASYLFAADQWDDPQMQFVTPNLVKDVSEGGGTYYVYHVATGKFLSNGNWLNNWNTEVEVKDKGQEVTLSWGQDYQLANVDASDPEYNDAYGWRITMKNAPTNGGFHELFLEPEKKIMCVDHNMQGHILWDIVETAEGSGVYRIKIASSDKLFGEGTETTATTVWGVAEGATGVNPLCDYETEAGLNAGVEWKFVDVAFYEAYQAKKSLKTALEEAVKAGYTAYTDAETVYMDAEATAEEVEEATQALNSAVLQYLYGSASESTPADVTSMLVNADFSGGTTGWDFWRESTMGGGDNLTVQVGRDPSKSDALWNEDHTVDYPNFAERWTATNPSNASSITQTVEGLPDGKYRFSAVVAINGVPADAAPEGIYVVATGLGAEQRAAIDRAITNTMIPNSIEFSVLGGTATIGVRATTPNFNWYAFAGVKLEYLGTEGAENMFTFLQDCIDNAKALVSEKEASNLYCSAAGMAKYDEMIDNEELQAVVQELEARMDSLEADYTAYEQMPEIVISLWDAYDSAPYAGLDCVLPYEDYLDETEKAIDEFAFNYLEKDSINVRANKILTECLQAGVQSGDIEDVTMLITNPTFDSNASGWSWSWADKAPGWGNGVGEYYEKKFDVYQTLKGLPVGSYKITVQGFYRPAIHDVCQQNWIAAAEGSDEVMAYLYGNDGMVKLPHLYKHVYDDALSDGTPTDVALSLPGDPERDGKYGLNNLKSTAEAFALGDYTTELVCYVQEDGELRFGVKTPEDSGIGGRWATFDNFTITYLGANDVTGLVYTLQNLVDDAQETYLKWADPSTEEGAYIPAANVVALEEAITAATDTLSKDELTLNAYNVCSKALNDAMDNGKDAIEYIQSMEVECDTYSEEINNGVYADYEAMPEFADFDEMIGTIYDNIDAIYGRIWLIQA